MKMRRFWLVVVLTLALVLSAASLAEAAPGDLDPSFGGHGIVTGSPGDSHAVAVQPDGKIVIAGQGWVGSVRGTILRRFNANGSLDATFVANGVPDPTYGVEGLVLDSSGRIVTAGSMGVGSESDFAVVRYEADGTLDTSFGGGGRVGIDFDSPWDWGYDLALDSSGRIVVAGSALGPSGIDMAVARLNPDGSLDPTFSGDGKALTDLSGAGDGASAVAVDSLGRIVAAGSSWTGTDHDFAVVRYNPDGAVDPTFDGDGMAFATVPGTREIGEAMTLDDADRIVVAGWSGVENSFGVEDFFVARFTTGGALDPAFDGDGMVMTDFFGQSDEGQGVTVDAAGRIILFGRAQTASSYDMALARYLPDGSLDDSFGSHGRVTTTLSGPVGWWGSVTTDIFGRIVAAGSVNNNYVLARYFGDEVQGHTINIKPGDPDNTVDLSERGKIDVAVLSAPGFDAPNQLMWGAFTFGRTGAEHSQLFRKGGVPNCYVNDVNGDRLPDLVCYFLVKLTGFQVGDTEGVLAGMTASGEPFEGRDRVQVVP